MAAIATGHRGEVSQAKESAPAPAPAAAERACAWLLNTYPLISTTFIRREIAALEAEGLVIRRFAARRWAGALVDADDRAEAARVEYLLSGRRPALIAGFFAALATRPFATLRAAGLAFSLYRKAGRGLARHIAWLLEAARFERRCREEKIAHVHAHFSTNAAAVAMLARAMGGPDYSFTVHGPDEIFEASRLDIPEKIARARFVVAISHYARAQLIRIAGQEAADKIHVVRCGLPLADYAPAPPATDPVLVCVGRLCPQKGQTQLPSIMASVRRDFPQAKLYLVGDGEDREAVEDEIAAYDVAEGVEILGWRSNEDVRRLIVSARALVLPTFAEGLPIVLMEAFALARPVVTTYVAGIPELVDERCGWIAPAGDEMALEGALRAALSADAQTLARLGAEGRRRVEARHDLAENARTLAALIRGGSPA